MADPALSRFYQQFALVSSLPNKVIHEIFRKSDQIQRPCQTQSVKQRSLPPESTDRLVIVHQLAAYVGLLAIQGQPGLPPRS